MMVHLQPPLLVVPSLALLALNLATEVPLEESFNFNVNDFLQLLRCINMILNRRDFIELGRNVN